MKYKDEILVLCENLHSLRKRNGLTQQEMAKILGISPRSLRRIEQNDLPMGLALDFIFSAAHYFHLRPAQLFCPLL